MMRSRVPSSCLSRPVRRRNLRGVTLVEVMLSMSLLVVLTSMTYWFYGEVLETRSEGAVEAQRLRLTRVLFDKMGTELRQATIHAEPNVAGIRGIGDRIWISTTRTPNGRRVIQPVTDQLRPDPPGEYDRAKVEYKIARHPDIVHDDGWMRALGLARVEHRLPRPDSLQTGQAREEIIQGGGRADDLALAQDPSQEQEEVLGVEEEGNVRGVQAGFDEIQWEELYSDQIKYMRFCYYDGNSWWDDWQVTGENPLPQLVMITLGFVEHPSLEESRGRDEINEEFCECLNRDPPDCEPLAPDQYSTVVRIMQADPLFRSRVTRESQAIADQLSSGGDEGEGDQP